MQHHHRGYKSTPSTNFAPATPAAAKPDDGPLFMFSYLPDRHNSNGQCMLIIRKKDEPNAKEGPGCC